MFNNYFICSIIKSGTSLNHCMKSQKKLESSAILTITK